MRKTSKDFLEKLTLAGPKGISCKANSSRKSLVCSLRKRGYCIGVVSRGHRNFYVALVPFFKNPAKLRLNVAYAVDQNTVCPSDDVHEREQVTVTAKDLLKGLIGFVFIVTCLFIIYSIFQFYFVR